MDLTKKIIIAIALIILVLFICSNKNIEKNGVKKIKYRVFTIEKGWTKWSKNGRTAGDNINGITKLEFDTNENISINYYDGKKWTSEKKNKRITGISFTTMYGFNEKYSLCYRTYNKRNKWLNWTCSNYENNISGNKNEDILSIQVKIIPRDVVLNDYLKDYKMNKYESSIGFE